jgi:hypothetical protein
MMSSNISYQDWWEATWRERESLFSKVFGETFPPGKVISFSWDDLNLMIPGGCALVFPPALPRRPEWLTISHGLTQPSEPPESDTTDVASGYGYEFGFLTRSKATWCPDALRQLMTYLRQSGASIERGHRVPMWFSSNSDSSYVATLGKHPFGSKAQLFGEMRAVLFWPYMHHPAGFSTSTGYFSILLGTTITQSEWEMAKETSTSHLLLILFEAGIGQESDLGRKTVTSDKQWRDRWQQLSKLPQAVVDEMLLQCCDSM